MGTELYPGIPFSPRAALTDNIGAADTIIKVTDVSAFPDAPNLATIGTDENGETVRYAAKTANALSGCERGVEGTARAWSAGEVIGRNFTAKDHKDLIEAVKNALSGMSAADAKQDKLTGQPGQVVGFNGMGLAYAVRGWSNPNLLDNWYFIDPENQRGQTEYVNDGYTIDRWTGYGRNVKLEGSDGIKMTANVVWGRITQNIENSELAGETVTFSVLYKGLSNGNIYIYFGPGDVQLAFSYAESGLITGTAVLPIDTNIYPVPCVFIAMDTVGASVNLIAAKLELGPVQTLAHQDASGNWVLNDPPPNKALELAKCQRYYIAGTNQWTMGGNVHGSGLVLPVPAVLRALPALVNLDNEIYVEDSWIPVTAIGVNIYTTHVEILYGINSAVAVGPVLFRRQPALDSDL